VKIRVLLALTLPVCGLIMADGRAQGIQNADSCIQTAKTLKAFEDGRFAWRSSAPLLAADGQGADPQVSIKDPTFVQYGGVWHLFATVRMKSGRVDIVYLNFKDWSQAGKSPRHILHLHDQYYCAPQVFYHAPQKRWTLVYQLADSNRVPPFGPYFSTTETLSDPLSWTRPRPLVTNAPEKPVWLDFWVIFDAKKAHLFYTSLDGKMWRCETKRSDFPDGWSSPRLAIEADIYEASHTYKLKGMDRYLTLIEAQGDRRRYYKAYLADSLEGPWTGLADTPGKPFAAFSNVFQNPPWTTNISHGELVRTGTDETMEVDPAELRFVFQGACDADYRGNPYGKIPWRLGILEMIR
jgi:hypothetical protein